MLSTIIFSKNRAMQLNLLLETLFNNCEDIKQVSDIYVLYKADEQHKESYNVLKKQYGYDDVLFVEETNFKQDLLNLIEYENVMFLVDDSVFTHKFKMRKVMSKLNNTKNAIGFSLRLGKNTTNCYPLNRKQNVPVAFFEDDKDIVEYYWPDADADFGYPLELSSSVYKRDDILPLLENLNYHNPNLLESGMAMNTYYAYNEKPILLCFRESVCLSDPLNKVQNFNQNRSENISADELLKKFEEGYKIDSSKFNGFVSNGAHQYVPVEFVRVENG